MDAPIFSIIIPTYNAGRVLKKSLDSILQQSFGGFEILVMDGESNDDSLEIARAYGDERIKIYSEKDKGIYDAMNKGVVRARGEWFFFLGSDDCLYDDDVLRDVLQQIALTKPDVIYGNVRIAGDTSWAKDGAVYDGIFDLKKILYKNICHQAIFYSAAVINLTGLYNIRYKVSADWDLNLRLWRKKWVFFDRIISRFQGGGTSTVSLADNEFRKDFYKTIKAVLTISAYDRDLMAGETDYYHNEVEQARKNENPVRYYIGRAASLFVRGIGRIKRLMLPGN